VTVVLLFRVLVILAAAGRRWAELLQQRPAASTGASTSTR
jgi:hypothetical protein